MLSTPTPALPTTWRDLAASRIAAVTFVSLRTTRASTSPRRAASSGSFKPVVWRTSQRARSNARPSSARGSAMWTMPRRLATGRDGIGRGPRGRARRRAAGLLLRALRVGAERGADRDARLDRLVEIPERELERAEERDDVLQGHEPEVRDADELSLHLSLAAGHDGVVLVAQDADQVPRVDPRGRTECRHRRRRVALVGEELEIHGLQPATCRAGEVAVASDDRFETLLGHGTERLLERDEDGDRRRRRGLRLLERCLVGAEVEVGLRQVRFLVGLPGARAHRDHRDPWGRAPGLLRRGHADVDAPLVHLELRASGARDAVDEKQLSRFTNDRGDVLDRVED